MTPETENSCSCEAALALLDGLWTGRLLGPLPSTWSQRTQSNKWNWRPSYMEYLRNGDHHPTWRISGMETIILRGVSQEWRPSSYVEYLRNGDHHPTWSISGMETIILRGVSQEWRPSSYVEYLRNGDHHPTWSISGMETIILRGISQEWRSSSYVEYLGNGDKTPYILTNKWELIDGHRGTQSEVKDMRNRDWRRRVWDKNSPIGYNEHYPCNKNTGTPLMSILKFKKERKSKIKNTLLLTIVTALYNKSLELKNKTKNPTKMILVKHNVQGQEGWSWLGACAQWLWRQPHTLGLAGLNLARAC
ncbi:uncharacterized protein LOC128594024 [Nycticebus coucang]|uniref:uncharacterized protein LOC128594024 n=1 Tax=Nycticebus coucang TaxID=9470 RepID=UPI00234C85D9|nr:uncharacterized protein LOC128594024 [Nycticebus coucang]